MSSEHRYTLIKKSKKYTCPYCNSPKSFRRYVDTVTGREIADECGICDHEKRCPQINYPPRDYFKDHPEQKKDWLKEHEPGKDWAMRGQVKTTLVATDLNTVPVASEKVWTLPDGYEERFRGQESVLGSWLAEIAAQHGISKELCVEVCQKYMVYGSGHMGAVIFWQKDAEGRIRSGKVMEYLPNGHRTGIPTWIHDALVKNGELPQGWELQQCLYGEHLLPMYPDMPVGVVESEKTALVCALFYPNMLWLASGGCGQLNAEKLEPLRGRKVYVFPDSGTFMKWKLILLQTEGIDISITSDLEKLPGNTDIADILLGEVEGRLPRIPGKVR